MSLPRSFTSRRILPQNPLIRICFDIDLDIQQAAQSRISQQQNPFDEDNLARINADCLIRTVVHRVIIDRALNALTIAKPFDMLNQQIRLQCIRMVIIQLLTLLKRNIIMPLIVIVMINNGNIISETATQSVRKSRLSDPVPPAIPIIMQSIS